MPTIVHCDANIDGIVEDLGILDPILADILRVNQPALLQYLVQRISQEQERVAVSNEENTSLRQAIYEYNSKLKSSSRSNKRLFKKNVELVNQLAKAVTATQVAEDLNADLNRRLEYLTNDTKGTQTVLQETQDELKNIRAELACSQQDLNWLHEEVAKLKKERAGIDPLEPPTIPEPPMFDGFKISEDTTKCPF